jgi:hypothetical protein
MGNILIGASIFGIGLLIGRIFKTWKEYLDETIRDFKLQLR